MSLLHIAGGATEDKLDASDVFSTYLYPGNGSTQTINNGIDLATYGGLVWGKCRSGAYGHTLVDTVRGAAGGNRLSTDNSAAQQTGAAIISSFNSNGFTLTGSTLGEINDSGLSNVVWTFRKAPKFFDIVTWTGDGVAGRQIPHNLGIAPGMIVVKTTSTTGDWSVYHVTGTGTQALKLNGTNAFFSNSGIWNNTSPTSTYFVVGDGSQTNASGQTYVAYLFAHDPSADGIIQCGSFTTTNGIGNANLGFEPQYVLVKGQTITGNWEIYDNMRGVTASNTSGTYINTAQRLKANLSDTEDTFSYGVGINQNGFNYNNGSASNTYIYLAIRRPNKVPTSGSEVYNAIARTGTGATATVTGVGFAPDLVAIKIRNTNYGYGHEFYERLTGALIWKDSSSTMVENAATQQLISYNMDGVTLGTSGGTGRANYSGATYINHFFKRAKGFMDIVCYTGTGVARTVNHNLGVVPELMVFKQRSGTEDWAVYHNDIGVGKWLRLSYTLASAANTTYLNNTIPTSSVLNVGSTSSSTNAVSQLYVAYLFATLANVSKCFSYTGNGTSLNVECGFSTGARFVLCKRTDSAGDWFIFDSVRGIVVANDPHLSLNTIAAEVTTDDSIDPYANGFTVNQNATTNLNVNGGTYIGLAIA